MIEQNCHFLQSHFSYNFIIELFNINEQLQQLIFFFSCSLLDLYTFHMLLLYQMAVLVVSLKKVVMELPESIWDLCNGVDLSC